MFNCHMQVTCRSGVSSVLHCSIPGRLLPLQSQTPSPWPLHKSQPDEHNRFHRTIAFAKSRKQSSDPSKGPKRDPRLDAGAFEPADEEEEWEDALTTTFPANKFGMEEEDEGEDEGDDDVLASAFRTSRRGSKRTEDDDEEEGAEAEDEFGDGDEGEVGEADDYDDAAELDEQEVAVGVPLENMDYADAVRARDNRSRTEAEVVQLSVEELRDRKAAESAIEAAKAAVIPDDAQLTLNRQGYQAFQMDGVDFLVAETTDGRMDLADSYYYDSGIEMYARPKLEGNVPAGPRLLQAIPWIERRSPDNLKGKEGMAKMKKVFMVGVASPEPNYRMAMEEVYCFQASTKTLSRCEVRIIGKPMDPVLRIRADGITIEDSIAMPNPSAVSLGTYMLPEPSDAEKEEALQQRIEELEAQAEQMDELDDVPDVPMSDMM